MKPEGHVVPVNRLGNIYPAAKARCNLINANKGIR